MWDTSVALHQLPIGYIRLFRKYPSTQIHVSAKQLYPLSKITASHKFDRIIVLNLLNNNFKLKKLINDTHKR